MSQTTALIVHYLMNEPDAWSKSKNAGMITNGYYHVALDASRYGMGESIYPCDGSDLKILSQAVETWKEDTDWQPEDVAPPMPVSRAPVAQAPDDVTRRAYEKFVKDVRAHFRSFKVHGDTRVLSVGVEKGLSELDAIMYPISRIEGKHA